MGKQFKSKNPTRPHRKLEKELLCSVWLMGALVITTSYIGIFKSNHIFEPEYTRNWSNTLLAMGTENFSAFFGYLDSIIPESASKCIDLRKPCIVEYLIRKADILLNEQRVINKDARLRMHSLWKLEVGLKIAPMSKIISLILGQLVKRLSEKASGPWAAS